MICVPIFQRVEVMDLTVKKLEIVRKGRDGLICMDNIRADIEVVFYVRVNDVKTKPKFMNPETGILEEDPNGFRNFWDIETVATQVGCERATETELLRQLFEAKFSEAIKSVGKEYEFERLYTDRVPFRQAIISTIGNDLNGYVLEDVAIDSLEQTPLQELDPVNVLDAQGIKKIVAITSEMEEASNERMRRKEIEIKDQDIRAQMDIKELERNYEEFLATKQKQLDDELASTFPEIETVEKIRAHIWNDHPVWKRINVLEEEVERLKSMIPPSS